MNIKLTVLGYDVM